MNRRWVLSVILISTGIVLSGAKEPSPAPPQEKPADQGARHIGNPYQAYSSGNYDQALQGFVDNQVERPDDLDVLFNVASAHYQMKNYDEAKKGFAQIALNGDPPRRAQALYNLGNCAYRQGDLQQAVDLYKQALDLDPDDQDSKFNLEFVRDEIRRRHEEAQKRQKEQSGQQQDQKKNESSETQQKGQEQPKQNQGDNQQQENQNQTQGQDAQQQSGAQDADRDGLPDDLERSASNPTDPGDADSDDDGLLDGQEDRNANGKVDPGETDPNKRDSDGDGLTDGQEAAGQQTDASQQAGAREQEGKRLSPEEAERYLQALREGRPVQKHVGKSAQERRPAKDW